MHASTRQSARHFRPSHGRLSQAIHLGLILAALPLAAYAQDAASTDTTKKVTSLERIDVTGTRIKQTDKVTSAPVAVITRAQIEKSGATTVGQYLQELTASGKALNAKFNSSGNFGYPADGGGIGAGSEQVDLRNLESKRVLVLVDGIRWVNESSASGVSGSADLSTIPLAIVERIEVLEDGASAIYGSDAIAGVVNVITRKKFDGALVHTKYGRYSGLGGPTKEGTVTIGGGSDKFNGVFAASYVEQDGISSSKFAQASAAPVPGAGIGSGSSGTPQGRFIFCDPGIASTGIGVDPTDGDLGFAVGPAGFCDHAQNDWFDITLNNGTTVPNYNGGNPTTGAGTYHNFSGADRFNYAPFNLLLTPSKRKSLFGSVNYNVNDNITLHGKLLYNNRTSTNQAAPEPLFVGPFAGTGGIADGINISHLNPFNPFGIDLNAATNLGFITKRPIELGPRVFTQDVDTWYANLGITGTGNWGSHSYDWNIDYVHSENKASQLFLNGFNIGKVKLALGDPAVCAASPGCVPLDLFGGEGRPITPAMLNYITTPQRDTSKQVLDLITANLTGDLWNMGERHAGYAVGYEHRRYQGSFNPDPLRQSGESQDSFAAPVSASYSVDEAYGELQIPWTASFSNDFAARYSNYSTFGSAVTYKFGTRWQPVQDLVFRGTYSTGFRAPNLGELFGLTQFGNTLVDPCGSTGHPGPAGPQYVAGCIAQGAPPNFEQANTQVTTFTGGNAHLKPEKSNSYNIGAVYSPSWADNLSWSRRLDFEFDYYNYKIKKGIKAPDIQFILNGCTAGTITGADCSGFHRMPGGNLIPPTDFLSNLGTFKTDGLDLKANYESPDWNWGRLSASVQATHTFSFSDNTQRAVGVEVNDSAIPSWQTNVQLGWKLHDWSAAWNVRYISAVKESCGNAAKTPATGCPTGDGFHNLGSTTYNDVQLAWDNSFGLTGLKLSGGVNNLFDRNPPVCVTCSLNGYDAGTYDLPGRFWYLSLDYKF